MKISLWNVAIATIVVLFLAIILGQWYSIQQTWRKLDQTCIDNKTDLVNWYRDNKTTILQSAQIEKSQREQYEQYLEAWMQGVDDVGMLWSDLQQRDPATALRLMNVLQDENEELKLYIDRNNTAYRSYNLFVRDMWNQIFLTSEQEETRDLLTIATESQRQTVETGVESEESLDLKLE